MSLRLEGHAILWAIALLSLAVVFARGGAETLVEGPGVEWDAGPDTLVAAGAVAYAGDGGNPAYPRSLPELTSVGRPLFAVAPGPQVQPMPAAAQATAPLLKGIVSEGGRPRAVFGTGGDAASYMTAGVGELAAGYRIERIEADAVIASSPGGETVVFRLRGAGELP
jgi:hypothetical protein